MEQKMKEFQERIQDKVALENESKEEMERLKVLLDKERQRNRQIEMEREKLKQLI